MPRLMRLSRYDRLPLFDQLRGELLINPYEEVRLMGRHFDADADGVADQADPVELDEHDHDACACEPGHIGDAGAYDGDDAPEVPAW